MKIRYAYAMGSPIRQHAVRAAGDSVRAQFYPMADPPYDEGNAIVWGKIRGAPELLKKIRDKGYTPWLMDNAYRGVNKYYRITKDHEQIREIGDYPADRWNIVSQAFNKKIRPWRKGGHIVIALSTKHAFKFHGDDLEQWLNKVQSTIRKHTDRKIVVRHKKAKSNIEHDLADAHALVTHMSMTALDALEYGVPIFVDDRSCALSMGLSTDQLDRIEDPYYPDDRERLFRALSYHQFTPDELRSGGWKNIRC